MNSQPQQLIFVFGSNLKGAHGLGAALYALQYYGAKLGQGVGPQGFSYAIPTKNRQFLPLRFNVIERYVIDFLVYAAQHPELQFLLTEIGYGYAGYAPEDIAPMFVLASGNVRMPRRFKAVLGLDRVAG